MSLLPRIVGHRGAPQLAPENTLASFRAAAEAGAEAVEFDVALTYDARPVVIHDTSLERTTNGTGLLAESTLEAISGLDAGSWFDRSFSGEVVPTLEETIDLLEVLGLGADIELKPDPGREVETAHIALAVAQECWPSDMQPPVITSFSRVALAAAKEAMPEWPRGLCFDLLPDDWTEAIETLGATMACPNAARLTGDQAASLVAAGLDVMAWTVNDGDQANRLLQWGVNSLCTDVPQELRSALAKRDLV
ncbi:MAG: glycerophosphoryl diester phosphodiesterase [Rhodospirillaceae bacterium]|jgi:glycerophosphoryl diester phosphodiesterase|nr:glycerophosphoryl diester phosphodiesterase [Rhodospirillaceae bacterium]MBT5241758.1 glycerophosphoryl diester phosphodiesterase [Rhodospirillaceae bacterium]MBT5566507.1 glycerophosphoryl diester phosphodiesterase [Rhodospirillaceae bacterium]MBT6089667.1 glycerophosphoryl diester phosphodiesterase [Rhodospirillaceae bacterium]MBT6960887.1 glycerophosphoryl diester phosphodiesterase [Rhodospirillaceae bacterium]